MTTLDTLAVAINAEHIAALGASRTALDHAHRAGDLLLQARAQLLHGQWLPWLAEHCNFSFRNAQVYMRIARLWPRLDEQRNAHPNTHLDITAARQLLAGTGAADDDDVGDDDDGVGDDEDDVTDDDITGDDLAGGAAVVAAAVNSGRCCICSSRCRTSPRSARTCAPWRLTWVLSRTTRRT